MCYTRSKIIAFSGGCFSGKTTTMKALQKVLTEKGYKVNVLSELIRNIVDVPIDELRKDAVKYFEVQKKIITEKINQERHAFNAIYKDLNCDCKYNTIFLVDRAISDSLFYFENYVDKSRLPDDKIIEYCKFHEHLVEYTYGAFRNYSVVAEFAPINNSTNTDIFRPKNIDFLKHYEHDVIQRINAVFNVVSNVSLYDLNKQSINEVVEDIIKKAGL